MAGDLGRRGAQEGAGLCPVAGRPRTASSTVDKDAAASSSSDASLYRPTTRSACASGCRASSRPGSRAMVGIPRTRSTRRPDRCAAGRATLIRRTTRRGRRQVAGHLGGRLTADGEDSSYKGQRGARIGALPQVYNVVQETDTSRRRQVAGHLLGHITADGEGFLVQGQRGARIGAAADGRRCSGRTTRHGRPGCRGILAARSRWWARR